MFKLGPGKRQALPSCSCIYPTRQDAIVVNKVNAIAWGLDADPTEIIPENAIPFVFNIHYCNIGSISNNDQYEIHLFKGPAGSEEQVARLSFDRSNTVGEGSIPVQTRILPANTRISAKLTASTAAARSVSIKLAYNVY